MRPKPLDRRLPAEPLEPRIVLSSVITLTDSDGDVYTVKLSGAGTANVVQDQDATERGPIFAIELSGTDKKSALSVSVKKVGDGMVTIAEITGAGPLAAIKAAKANLVGAGIDLGGTGADKLKITLGMVADGVSITTLSQLSSLTATSIGDATIAAPLIGKLSTTAGAMLADLNVPGAVGSVAVKGGDAGGMWTAASFGKVTVTGSDFDATLVSTAAAASLGKKPALAKLSVAGGDLTGGVFALGNVGGVSVAAKRGLGGAMDDATLVAMSFGNIGAARVEDSRVLAGANLGSDRALGGTGDAADTFGPGTIGRFSVGGAVTESVLGAGLTSDDAVLGDEDDGFVGGLTSRVKSFTIKGAADSDSFFAAAVFPKTVKIGTAKITPPTDPLGRFLTSGSPELGLPTIFADLANDTGLSAADGISSDPAIAGTATDNIAVTKLSARFGAGAFIDVTSSMAPDGDFALNLSRLNKINGSKLVDGNYRLELEAMDAAGNATTFDVPFTLDRTAPGAPTIDLSPISDTGALGDKTTSAGIVTLAGATDPGALLTVGTLQALATNTGNFALPGVALANGANNFTVAVTDAAGNRSKNSSVTITRTGAGGTDVVLEWNAVNLEAIRLDSTAPPVATRGLAMVSGAMFDVVSAFEGTPGFFTTQSAPAGASSEAAIAAAAHRVLAELFPGQQAFLDAALATTLARVPDGAAETAGAAFGQAIGQTIIELRAGDGYDLYVSYVPSNAPGDWQESGPMFAPALLPNWATLDPFAMDAPDQFRPDGPPALDSQEYADAFNEVKALGVATGSTRTADETQIARFWADGAGTFTPPGHWNQIAAEVAADRGNSVSANARLLAALNVAMADAAIVSWDAKYSYDFWRPITAIQNADTDGNAQTAPDADWRPLLITPPFPDYISGHSTFSGAAAAVLTEIFGGNVAFDTTSVGLPGVTRDFTSFDQAAEEASRSRVLGGIHWSFACVDGLEAGRAVGELVLDRFEIAGDFAAPAILVQQPASGLVTSVGFSVEGRVLDNISGVASLRAQLDAGAGTNVNFGMDGSFSVPVTLPLADGAHVLRLLASDNAGNAATPIDFAFTLDTLVPALEIDTPLDDATLALGSHLTGTADATGSALTALSYSFDGGMAMPLSFDAVTGDFDAVLDLSKLDAGAHTLTISARDAAGLTTSTTLDVMLAAPIPFALIGATPGAGALDVGTTFRPQIFFSRPVDPSSLNANNFFATDTAGEKIDATIVPALDGTFAWLFFDDPMPGGAVTTLHVEGTTIMSATGGQTLDADRDGTPGGSFTSTFTTVSLTPLPGTSLAGRVLDPGGDLKPMTFDDLRAGADGILHTADDIYLNPLAGVKVFIIGLESQAVFTDAQGNFSFASVPAGNIKLAVDGRTATNEPPGVFFPEMVMDLVIEPGVANTVMGTMGTLDQRAANLDRPEVYLPRIQSSILQSVSNIDPTMIGVNADAAPNLTPEQRSQLTLEIQPQSLIGADGQPLTAGQVGISTVPPELVREMLPPGVLQHTFDITIQAPDAATFAAPAVLTFPNVFNAPPGSKLDFLSFDHTTGRLVIEGTATVSADGLTATTDPGIGITKPGWHGLTPPGLCGGSGGPPLLPPPTPQPGDVVNIHPAESIGMIFGEFGPELQLFWEAPDLVPGAGAPVMQPGCNVPQRPPPGSVQQPFLHVTIEVDGPLATFMKKPGSLRGGLDLASQSFVLLAGTEGEVIFAAEAKSYEELFGPDGFAALSRDQLYGSKIKVTEIRSDENGDRTYDIFTFYTYRWVDVIDAEKAKDKTGNTAAFVKTLADGAGNFQRLKFVDAQLPTTVETTFLTSPPFDFDLGSATASGRQLLAWEFDPQSAGNFSTPLQIRVNDGGLLTVGTLDAKGTGAPVTRLSVNLDDPATGYKAELKRAILSLVDVWFPGADGVPGSPGDDDQNGSVNTQAEYGFPGHPGPPAFPPADDELRTMYVYSGRIGFLERTTVGPDGRTGVAGVDDDGFNGIDLAGDELGAAGSDDLDVRVRRPASVEGTDFLFVSERFKALFAGFMPADRSEAGADGKMGTRDDQFSAAQLAALDARIEQEAMDVLAEVEKDFEPIEDAIIFQTDNAGADVVMDWRDSFSGTHPVFGGTSQYDHNLAKMRELVGTPGRTDPVTGDTFNLEISDAAQGWALAQFINEDLADNGEFGVGIHFQLTNAATTFAQYVANTVSHELAHTLGLSEGYYVGSEAHRHGVAGDGAGEGGTARVNARNNAFPYQSLMNNGGAADGDFAFKHPTEDILKAAVGLAPNTSSGLDDALKLWRDSFNLVNGRYGDGTHDSNGLRDQEPFPETNAQIALFDGVRHLFGLDGESMALGRAAADGAGGQTLSFSFDLINEGVVPLTISSLGFLGGGAGFSILTPGVAGTPIAPGGEVTLSIGFDPAAIGAASDTLRIQSNAEFMPDFRVALSAEGFSFAPLASLAAAAENNFGGVKVASGSAQKAEFATVTNDGFQPLLISDIRLAEGLGPFSLLGVPVDLMTNPISLDTGESFTFGLGFDPNRIGLDRAVFEVVSNDPLAPVVRASAVGTGLDSVVYPEWGEDFVAFETPRLATSVELRAKSDTRGNFEFFLPPEEFYHLAVFDPATGLTSHGFGDTGRSGAGRDLTASLVFGASIAPDTDGDGLPDDIEFAIGTSGSKVDSDGDGVRDFVEIVQGTDPLGGRALPTGVVSILALPGEAKEVVVAGSLLDAGQQTGYVATGTHGLAIVDTSRLTMPVLLGQLDLPGTANDVAVDTAIGVAAVASGAGGLHLVDVSDPLTPALLRTINVNAVATEIIDGVAFATVGANVQAFDALTGDGLDTLALGGASLTGLAREGAFLYTMDTANTLRVIDVSGISMLARGSVGLSAGGGKLFVGNGVAFAAAEGALPGGFATADVSDPDAPTLLSGADSLTIAGRDFAGNGSGLGILVGSPGVGSPPAVLDVVSVTDPANTADFRTRVNLPTEPEGVAVASGIAYVAGGTSGLIVVNYLGFDTGDAPPVVDIVSPIPDLNPGAPGVQISEGSSIPVRVEATDDVQVSRVELLVNGELTASAVSFPFELGAVGLSTIGSTLTLQARATDTGGNVMLSAPLVFELVPDTFAPAVTAITPADDAKSVQGLRSISVLFSEPLDPATVTAANFLLRDAASQLVAPQSLQLRGDDRIVALTYAPLGADEYTLTIDETVADRAGNLLGADVLSGFELVDATISWVGGVSQFWDDAGNWSTGVLPVTGDTVFIPQSAAVTHRTGTDTIAGLLNSGLLTIDNLSTLAVSGSGDVGGTLVVQNSGVLSGAGTVTVTGSLEWRGGILLGSGATTIAASGSLLIAPPGAGHFNRLTERTLNNAGTGTWMGAGSNIIFANGAVFNNSGSLTTPDDHGLAQSSGAAGVFNNSGTFTKSGGAGEFFSNIAFHNTGTLDVQSGNARLTVGATHSGTFNAGSGSTIEFEAGTHTLNTGAAFTGAGIVQLNGPTLTVAGNVTAQNFDIPGGTLNGAGTFTVNGSMTWSAGTMSGSGATTIASGATLAISGATTKALTARALNIAGTATWTGTGNLQLSNGAVISNSGTFDAQNDELFQLVVGGTAPVFNNSGTFIKSVATGTTTFGVAFNNTGTLEVQTGTVSLPAGTINNGIYTVRKAATLSVAGAFANATAATINLDLGGLGAPDFASLAISGAATLAGTLAVFLVDGFTPNVADTFTVLTYSSRTGTFAAITDNDPAHVFNPTYNATNLTLTVA